MTEPTPIEIECRDVKAMLDRGEDFLFIDCRQADEWEIVRIAGTQLLPMHEIAQRAGELEPHREKPIVVHCHHGGRSLRVVHWLRQQGFDRARNLSGGIDRWATDIDASLPRY
jgi:rhodanese-related sulfurtransferase